MLTCNKNFVDLTVWILRSWTCIELNIMLHQSLEEERQPGDRTKSIVTPSNRTEQNQTGLSPDWTWRNWISALNVNVGRIDWTFWYFLLPNGTFDWTDQSSVGWRVSLEGLVGFDVACVAYNGVFVLMISCSRGEWGRFHTVCQSYTCLP